MSTLSGLGNSATGFLKWLGSSILGLSRLVRGVESFESRPFILLRHIGGQCRRRSGCLAYGLLAVVAVGWAAMPRLLHFLQVARYVVSCVLGFAVTVAAALLPLGCHFGEIEGSSWLACCFLLLARVVAGGSWRRLCRDRRRVSDSTHPSTYPTLWRTGRAKP